MEKKRNKQGLTDLARSDVPKPARINALIRHIKRLHKEIMEAKNMTSVIALKDPRIVKNYHIVLAKLKMAQLEIEEMTEKLQIALHGK